MTFVYIAVLLVALAFALISIYIAKILLRVSVLFSTLGRTVDSLEQQLDKTVLELGRFIFEIENTATDVESKLIAADGLFLSVSNVGETASIVSKDLLSRTKSYAEDSSLSGTKPFVRIIQCSEFSSAIFHSWKRGKRTSS